MGDVAHLVPAPQGIDGRTLDCLTDDDVGHVISCRGKVGACLNTRGKWSVTHAIQDATVIGLMRDLEVEVVLPAGAVRVSVFFAHAVARQISYRVR